MSLFTQYDEYIIEIQQAHQGESHYQTGDTLINVWSYEDPSVSPPQALIAEMISVGLRMAVGDDDIELCSPPIWEREPTQVAQLSIPVPAKR